MPEDNENEQSGKGLRGQLEQALARISELEGQVEAGTGAQRELAFRKAGIDLDSGPGKLLAKSYDGALDADDIVAFAEEYGISPTPSSTEQAPNPEREQQQRTEGLRQQSTPEGAGQRLDHKEWQQLSKSDPQAAKLALSKGMVDFPSHIAQSLSA